MTPNNDSLLIPLALTLARVCGCGHCAETHKDGRCVGCTCTEYRRDTRNDEQVNEILFAREAA
jgi:hypothetical protein